MFPKNLKVLMSSPSFDFLVGVVWSYSIKMLEEPRHEQLGEGRTHACS
jgi:hypothetical protein